MANPEAIDSKQPDANTQAKAPKGLIFLTPKTDQPTNDNRSVLLEGKASLIDQLPANFEDDLAKTFHDAVYKALMDGKGAVKDKPLLKAMDVAQAKVDVANLNAAKQEQLKHDLPSILQKAGVSGEFARELYDEIGADKHGMLRACAVQGYAEAHKLSSGLIKDAALNQLTSEFPKMGTHNVCDCNDKEADSIDLLRNSIDNRQDSAQILASLAISPNLEYRKLAAGDPNTPENSLVTLDSDESYLVRQELIYNPSTPVNLKRALAHDPDNDIRAQLAEDPSTPAEILWDFIKTPDCKVREYVADNPRATGEMLSYLAKDADPEVQIQVATNHNVPVEVLAELAASPNASIRQVVASVAFTPSETFALLARDAHASVRECVAKNVAAPLATIEMLTNDVDTNVREEAANALRERSKPGS
jgi:hypothetical protein